MKKLNVKAFWIIIVGILSAIIYRIIDLLASRNREFPALKERMSAERLERLSTAMFRLNAISAIIFALICVYFIYRLIKNKKEKQGQGYITFLFVLNTISAIFNVLSLLFGNITALISIGINIAIIAGCYIQRKYEHADIEAQPSV